MQSNLKIYLYVLQLTVISGVILALLNNVLGPTIAQNKKEARLTSILKSIPDWNEESAKGSIEQFFNKTVKTVLVNEDATVVYESTNVQADSALIQSKLNPRGTSYKKSLFEVDPSEEEKVKDQTQALYPIFKYDQGNNDTLYIVAVRGNGLWDKIWGYISLDKNLAVKGVYFDHKGETPGLGAEIKDNAEFKTQFKGKKIYTNGGEYASVTVKKKAPKGDHQVQGISGATITSDGVTGMMVKGIKRYETYFKKYITK